MAGLSDILQPRAEPADSPEIELSVGEGSTSGSEQTRGEERQVTETCVVLCGCPYAGFEAC